MAPIAYKLGHGTRRAWAHPTVNGCSTSIISRIELSSLPRVAGSTAASRSARSFATRSSKTANSATSDRSLKPSPMRRPIVTFESSGGRNRRNFKSLSIGLWSGRTGVRMASRIKDPKQAIETGAVRRRRSLRQASDQNEMPRISRASSSDRASVSWRFASGDPIGTLVADAGCGLTVNSPSGRSRHTRHKGVRQSSSSRRAATCSSAIRRRSTHARRPR